MTHTNAIVVECQLRFERKGRGARKLPVSSRQNGDSPTQSAQGDTTGQVPRVARLLALAHQCEELIRNGTVADQATLARLGNVTRARMSQIMNLLNLAPDIQEAILFLPRYTTGRAPVILTNLQAIANEPEWGRQRGMWGKLILSVV